MCNKRCAKESGSCKALFALTWDGASPRLRKLMGAGLGEHHLLRDAIVNESLDSGCIFCGE
jgi:hypothetical protein